MDTARMCAKCNTEGQVSEMVGCDMCDVWLHHGCAGIDSTNVNPDVSWRCEKCLLDEATEIVSQASQKTTKSSHSRARRAELALRQLEEKQALIERQRAEEDALRKKRSEEDAQLLQEKLALQLAVEDECSSIRSGLSSRASHKKVEDWLEKGPDGGKQANGNQKVEPPPTCTSLTVTPLAVPTTVGYRRGAHITEVPTTNSAPQGASTPNLTATSSTNPHFTVHQAGLPPVTMSVSSFSSRGIFPVPTTYSVTNSGFPTTLWYNNMNMPQMYNPNPLGNSGFNWGNTGLMPPWAGATGPYVSTATSRESATALTTASSTTTVPSVGGTNIPEQHENFGPRPQVPSNLPPGPPNIPKQQQIPPPVPQVPQILPPGPLNTPEQQPILQSVQQNIPPPGPQVPQFLPPGPLNIPGQQPIPQPVQQQNLGPVPQVPLILPPGSSNIPGQQPIPQPVQQQEPVPQVPQVSQIVPQVPLQPRLQQIPQPMFQAPQILPQVPQVPPAPQQNGMLYRTGATAMQLAARQVISKDLPQFAGNPEDWPIFSSSFYNSTATCGYSNAENLSRLQKCLKGAALTEVKSRLLLPESVPYIMEALRKRFGRPEVLVQALYKKLDETPPPKLNDNESIVTFGSAVRNLVDHLYVSNLVEHLRNPMIVLNLETKLPPMYQMWWSSYKDTQPDVNLATFGNFISELADRAAQFTLKAGAAGSSGLSTQPTKGTKSTRDKQKLYAHSSSDDGPKQTDSKQKPSLTTGSFKKVCSYCSNDKHEAAGCPQFKALDLDARWKAIRTKGLCRTCLIPHRKWPCRSGKECGVDGCQFRHHALLHTRAAQYATAGQSTSTGNSNVASQNHHSSMNYSLFRYLPVTLEGNGKRVETFAFLDDGCSSTLMEAGLANELNIEGPAESLWLAWTGNISREEKGSQRVSVKVSGTGIKTQYKMNNVRTVQKLKLQGQTFQYEKLQETYPHLKGLPLHSYKDAVPRIIIGIEHAQLLTSLKVREGRANEPIAAKTRLGWCVYGKQINGSSAVEQLNIHSEAELGNRELHELMKQYFGIEEAAVATPPESKEDERARKIMEATTKRVEGGFETGLLWRYDQPAFPNSYPLAERRMHSLEKRLAKEPELRARVNQLITEYEAKGYAHRITIAEMEKADQDRVWYLPLGVVRNPKKPDKVRLIWDAAARVHGTCFNDMLLKGPDMLTDLFKVLIRFRQRSVAVGGDIREMFHQVRIIDEDKQSQRFLHREHPDQQPQIYVMDVATFGATCSPCVAQHVKNTNAKEFEDQFPRAYEAIIKSHYVDDLLDSVDTIDEAVQLVNEVHYVHAQGGFDIRNFSSNSLEVLQRIGETQQSQNKSMNLDKLAEVERVLGMEWKPSLDVFTFNTALKDEIDQLLITGEIPTKRQVLRLVMSLFDPYGFIAHYIVHGKILMQHIWRSGTDWDEKIAGNLHQLWFDWTELLKRLDEVEVPRCFFGSLSSKSHSSIQLHVFVDASELAYACVAYLRIVQEGNVRCALVAAKTKVSPLKPLSIPRLELQGLLIGCRLLDNLGDALDLPIEERFIWTDSRTVISWVRSDSRRYHPFVAFRVGEILNLINVNELHYVPSKLNVADDATKWGSGPSFNPNSRWYTGPSFLYQSKDKWPEQPEGQWATEDELRVAYQHHREVTAPIIDVGRFSNWQRLLRATAMTLRAAKRFRRTKITGLLSRDELLQAENFLWRQAQLQAFPDEYCILEHNMKHTEKEPKQIEQRSHLYDKSPFLDDAGVIRMNSRIGAAPTAPFEAKYPVILPTDHALTALLVDSYHRRFKHRNNETVFNMMRQEFSIARLRPLIKKVAKRCQHCTIRDAAPRPPRMAPHSKVRLTPHIRAFTYTGVDYFGPLQVKQGRGLAKRWVALFTCLTTRAVHLEVVHSLSTQSCVMAIRRFVGLRGSPLAFYSDNGTCFQGASKLLAEQIQGIHEDCAVTFTNAKTSWHFNPPSAPHMGGCWERMVRSIKAALGDIADYTRHPSDEVLETVLREAEAIVNSRPLTYVPLDDECQEALTPYHFLLYGTQGVVHPRTSMVQEGAALREGWNQARHLADLFWKRWVREYMPTLTRRTKWFELVEPLKPGDLVMVVESSQRNGWLRGRVVKVFKGKDGQVRSAVIRIANGNIMKRPAVRIAKLDVLDRNQKQGSPELHGWGNVENYSKQSASTAQSDVSPGIPCLSVAMSGTHSPMAVQRKKSGMSKTTSARRSYGSHLVDSAENN